MDHTYCVPDSSSDLLDCILSLDAPDAIPFSVTEMELSSSTRKHDFRTRVFRNWYVLRGTT